MLAKYNFITIFQQKIKFVRLKIMWLCISYKKKNRKKFLGGILEVIEERSRILIRIWNRIRTNMSRILNTALNQILYFSYQKIPSVSYLIGLKTLIFALTSLN
jgi:hypothetical protein